MAPSETTPQETRITSAPITAPSWTEQDEQLTALWGKGEKPEDIAVVLKRSVAAVMTRAARLGLQRRFAPGRKPKKIGDLADSHANMRAMARLNSQLQTVAPQQSHRICLMCLTRFQSQGRHNRICSNCKESPAYRSASGLPDVDIQE